VGLSRVVVPDGGDAGRESQTILFAMECKLRTRRMGINNGNVVSVSALSKRMETLRRINDYLAEVDGLKHIVACSGLVCDLQARVTSFLDEG